MLIASYFLAHLAAVVVSAGESVPFALFTPASYLDAALPDEAEAHILVRTSPSCITPAKLDVGLVGPSLHLRLSSSDIQLSALRLA